MYDLIQNWLMVATGYDAENVFRMRQGGPRPTGNYITYYLISSNIVQRPVTSMIDAGSDDNVVVSYTALETAVYGIDVHAYDGREVLNKIGLSKNVLVPRLLLREYDVTLLNKAITRDLSLFGDTKWRFRFQADFTFLRWAETSEINQRVLNYEIHWVFDTQEYIVEV